MFCVTVPSLNRHRPYRSIHEHDTLVSALDDAQALADAGLDPVIFHRYCMANTNREVDVASTNASTRLVIIDNADYYNPAAK